MNEEILKRIDLLAAKLGVTADHIWAVLVKQARVEAAEWIIWSLFWFILSGACAYMSRWLYKLEKTGNRSHEVEEAYFLFAAVPSGIAFVIAAGCLANILTLFVNPEYWALKQIMEMMKGK